MRAKKDWVTMSFRLDAKTAQRLRDHADKLGQSYTVALERIVNAYLDEKESKKEGDRL